MTKFNSAPVQNNNKVRLCQLVASTYRVEPVLSTGQIASRLGLSTKTVRNWLKQAKDAPKAFKDQNEWQVRTSEYQKWEQASKKS